MRKYLAIILSLAFILTIFVGCGTDGSTTASQTQSATPSSSSTKGSESSSSESSDNLYKEKIVFTASSVDVDANADYHNEARYQFLNDMFNFEIEFVPVSWDTWAERDRIWINSGDMPDVMFWDFNYNDYLKYARDGILKPLPDDYESKYPNLANVIKRTEVADFLKEKFDGKLYAIPHVIYQTPITELSIDSRVAFYRKDWAKALGIELDELTTAEELKDLALQMIEKDPGGNGSGKTIGITSSPPYFYMAFIMPFNKHFDEFYFNGSEYVYGPFEKETLDGIKYVKELLDSGAIDRDFYTVKGLEYRDKFMAGKAGIWLDGCSVSHYAVEFTGQFKEANPELDPFDAMGITAVTGNDGIYYAQNIMNYWSCSIFNADISDEKMDRILSIFDYISTQEGQYLVYLGVEGIDYTIENGQYIVKKDENGNVPVSQMKNYFWTKPILPDDWALRDPTIDESARQTVLNIFKAKEKNMDIRMLDYDLLFLSSPEKSNFSLNVSDAITQILLSQKDVETAWTEWKQSVEPSVQTVLDEINRELLGK